MVKSIKAKQFHFNMFKVENAKQNTTIKALGEPNFIPLLSPWWQAYVPLSCTHIQNMQ